MSVRRESSLTELESKSVLLVLAFVVSLMVVFSWSRPSTASYVGTPYAGERPGLFELHVGPAFHDMGMAVGGRFGIPIVDNGFISRINNAVYLSLGADYYLVDYNGNLHGALGIPLVLHWEFYLAEKWSVYAEAGFNVYIHPSIFQGDGWVWSTSHWIEGSVGGRYHINEKVALTLNLGNPYSSFGVLFKF